MAERAAKFDEIEIPLLSGGVLLVRSTRGRRDVAIGWREASGEEPKWLSVLTRDEQSALHRAVRAVQRPSGYRWPGSF